MEWNPGGISSDIEDRRGDSGGGGGFGFGGGGIGIGGLLLLLVISLVTGRNYIGQFFSSGAASQPGPQQYQTNGQVEQSPAEAKDVQLVSWILDDVQRTWTTALPEQTGRNYRRAKLVLFRGRTNSGCGTARSATGPFYCPEDERVYIDLAFWNDLRRLGGNSSDFAQGYVIAHELGHHVQNILGTESKVQQAMQNNPAQRSPLSVALELQADCYAGVWANLAKDRAKLNAQDIAAALNNAAAVGDDHIQKMERGTVSPETFTHGSSAQRQAWFRRGWETGQVSQCNTFRTSAQPQGDE